MLYAAYVRLFNRLFFFILQFCALYPDMVESLVLLDSYGFLPIDVVQARKQTNKNQ